MVVTNIYSVIIIGSGPSGYTAGIYTGRAGLKPLLFAGEMFGGQLMTTTEIENFPGFQKGIMGPLLMMEMRNQAERFDVEIINANVTKVDFSTYPFKVWQGETEYQARAVIISTGAKALTLNLPHEKEFYGKGISSCAVCDGAFYKEKTVYVVGGGDSAMEETLVLSRFAAKVFVVVRRDEFRASKIMQQKVLSNPKVEVLWNTEVTGLKTNDKLEGLVLKNNKTGKEWEVKADGLFYAIGHVPQTELFENDIKKDEKGYILTPLNGLITNDPLYDIWLHKYPTATSVEGVFAAGDAVDFHYRQAITAAGFGAMAAIDAERWLEEKNGK
jgi:thioredoxin reductase (NADPH)